MVLGSRKNLQGEFSDSPKFSIHMEKIVIAKYHPRREWNKKIDISSISSFDGIC